MVDSMHRRLRLSHDRLHEWERWTPEQRRAHARIGSRVGVTKPTVQARKAKRRKRTRSR